MHERVSNSSGTSRYPGYDVLSKWSGPSWNEKTRQVIARRLSLRPEPRFFTADEFAMVTAIAARIVPQPAARPSIPVAALVDHKLHQGIMDGYRVAGMPRDGEAWRIGLKALDAEAVIAYGGRFTSISNDHQDDLLRHTENDEMRAPEWGTMRSCDFFKKRMARDIVLAYYAHPTAWSEIGWGGPASPRGYVRLDFNDRDPWEAAEAKNGNEVPALRINRYVR
jgi:Gluconate 2-dehydrogenase subunit 3